MTSKSISIIGCLLFFFIHPPAQAQQKRALAIGLTTGYRYNNSSLYLEYGLLKKCIITGELTTNSKSGAGYAVSSYYSVYTLPHTLLSVQTGLSYQRHQAAI